MFHMRGGRSLCKGLLFACLTKKKKSNVDKLLLFSIQMVTMNVIARVVSVDVLEYVYWELVYHLYIAPSYMTVLAYLLTVFVDAITHKCVNLE